MTWFLIASLITADQQTIYEPDKRFSSYAECSSEAARVNLRWRHEDMIGMATCRPDTEGEFP